MRRGPTREELKTGPTPAIPTMMKLGNKKKEFEERRMLLYFELQRRGMSLSCQEFEHVIRQINILTYKIRSFKGGLYNDQE